MAAIAILFNNIINENQKIYGNDDDFEAILPSNDINKNEENLNNKDKIKNEKNKNWPLRLLKIINLVIKKNSNKNYF
jgi:hypothetical protein